MLQIPEGQVIDWVWGALSALGAALMGGVSMLLHKIGAHGKRITDIERDMVGREDHDKALADVYRKIDDGFKYVAERLDRLYELLTHRTQ